MPSGKPMKSKAMNAAMHSAAAGKSTLGIPKAVGKKMVAEAHGQSMKGMPMHAKPPKSGGKGKK